MSIAEWFAYLAAIIGVLWAMYWPWLVAKSKAQAAKLAISFDMKYVAAAIISLFVLLVTVMAMLAALHSLLPGMLADNGENIFGIFMAVFTWSMTFTMGFKKFFDYLYQAAAS